MDLKVASTKIPSNWIERLAELSELENVSQSAIIRKAIGKYLGLESVDSENPVDLIRSEIEQIKTRLTALESTGLTEGRPPDPIVESTKPIKSRPQQQAPVEGQAMNADELHKLLTARGYTKGIAVLRRSLVVAREKGELPTALVEMGVTADFEGRAAVGDKVKARWLFISEVKS